MQSAGKVFISYSREDADLVARLKAALTQAGLAVWLDHEQLKADTLDWQEAVRKGSLQVTAVIYVASPTAARSPYVIHEITMAKGLEKPVICFWMRGEQWYDSAPMGWINAQYTDGRGVAFTGGLKSLLSSLGVIVEPLVAVANTNDSPRFGYGAAPRALPIYCLLDCSADMAGAPIEALREGMRKFYDELMSDTETRSKAKLSVITFGGGAEQTALVPVKSMAPPRLEASGTRTLGAALRLLAQSLTEDVVLSTRERRGDYAPIVFVLLGGAIEVEWQTVASLIHNLRYNAKPTMVGLGAGPEADVEALASICGGNVLFMRDTNSQQLREFFKFISGSVPGSRPRN